jgi:DDE superfamily endonuclease
VLEPGSTSWTLPLDAVRLGPAGDATAVTAAQLRDVITRLIAAGHWKPGDPDIIVVLDAGYDLTRLARLLADLPADLTGRLRSTGSCTSRPRRPRHGRPPRAGPAVTTVTGTARYGTATAMAWPRLHQRLEPTDALLHRLDKPLVRDRRAAGSDVRLDHPPAASPALIDEHLQGSCAERPRRNPKLHGRKSASKTGSSTIFSAACTIRSRTAGTCASYSCPFQALFCLGFGVFGELVGAGGTFPAGRSARRRG